MIIKKYKTPKYQAEAFEVLETLMAELEANMFLLDDDIDSPEQMIEAGLWDIKQILNKEFDL